MPPSARVTLPTTRRMASALLAAMAVLFLIARHGAAHGNVPWGAIRAFAEAALVGGLADWFAVTALFRHPLGLPIPHTAIIPDNKDRIADSMASFLRTHFLTVPVVARRLRGLNLAGAIGGFLAEPRPVTEGRLRTGLATLARDAMAVLDGEGQLGRMVRTAVSRQIDRIDLAPLLGQLLAAMLADGRHRPVLEAGLRWAGVVLEENEAMLRDIIHVRANSILRWTGLDERLANGILDGLYKLLAECIVDPEHPLRLRLEAGLASLAHDLQHDPAMRARVARAKREVLANPAMAAWMEGMWTRLRDRVLEGTRTPGGTMQVRLGGGIARMGAAIGRDPELNALVARVARRMLVGAAVRYGATIVTLVSDTVKRWDAGTITTRIEAAVGRDLQFIRINGTLVGGLVGLTLFLLDRIFTALV